MRFLPYGFAIPILRFFLKLYAFEPFTEKPYINSLLTALWLSVFSIFLTVVSYLYMKEQNNSVGALVEHVFFTTQVVANVIVLIEAFTKRQKLSIAREMLFTILYNRSRGLFAGVDLKQIWKKVNFNLTLIGLVSTVCFGLIFWIHLHQSDATPIFWCVFCLKQALRIRLMQVIACLMIVSEELKILNTVLQNVARQNRIKTIDALWKPSTAEEIQVLVALRTSYDQFFDLSILLNKCFGWSILTISTTFFFEFVCNAYFLFLLIRWGGELYGFAVSGAIIVSLGLLMTSLCWYAHLCFENSKYIGSSIFKLSKPLGNKRYNDLVSEFSLQALHQKFAVSAKDFFQLNLDLLGSMVGAIVTYLVILIQFMFTERNGSKISVPNSSLQGAVADVALKN